jgi:hypothetical protein
MALMTVEIAGEKPGIAHAAKALGVDSHALDKSFGVVPIDPARHLYAVQVREDAVAKRRPKPGSDGPFSNPRIEPYGPIRRR